MKDELVTGVTAAVMIDTLLSLGVDDPLALTHDDQVLKLERAMADGRIDEQRLGALRELGVLPPL